MLSFSFFLVLVFQGYALKAAISQKSELHKKVITYDMPSHGSKKKNFSYDMVTGQEYSLFYFMASPLGQALRLSARLMGDLHAAADDPYVLAELNDEIIEFSFRVLDLNTLSDVARFDVIKQLKENPEKGRYLLSEIAHLQERTILLLDTFRNVFGQNFNQYSITIVITLEYMAKKIGQMLVV